MLYVLKEQLLRDLNIEVLKSDKIKSFGLDQVIRIFSQDQSCFKIRNEILDYDKIMEDKKLLEFHLVDFTQKLSNSLQIPIDQIEILGVSKGSFEINFLIKGKTYDEIQQLIQNIPAAQIYLHKYCNGKIEYLTYFDYARDTGEQLAKSSGIILSSDDFNPKYNMKWSNFKEKEQRGPPDHRYDYYFPRGCYGFGLDIKKYGENQDWIQMDGNPNEWRIMYHGTIQNFVNSIVKNNLMPGLNNLYANDDCQDEFGNMIKVGNGIYFSNDFNVCTRDKYASYTQVLDKQFAVIFMTRVNPKKIRQSQKMKLKNYFVVNESKDVRPYRILLHEKKKGIYNYLSFLFFK
ncbi:unnamed protein product [Paramecium primaurelia]|uniref:Uncharacterized protein n=1 Tax=Paramecium primaurelia TaxID=5886 RepID=A0A8S1QGF0_PARPR|nr:unnamed protein product [Paramecium primaurelia]